jgi:hypothetical protein
MQSIKISVTCAKTFAAKYDPAALKKIDQAIKAWVAADDKRGIRNIYVPLDDSAAMKKLGATAITGKPTANKVKKAIDALVARLSPDYIAIIGADDVVPMFEVSNPTLDPNGDTDPKVPTDNPYACSKKFSANKRSSYLIPDRVIGRIPDLKGSADPSWLIDYLAAATEQKSLPASSYADSLLACCDTWKESGRACVHYIARSVADLMICPPIGHSNPTMKGRHGAQLHMIKCHGAELTSRFFGQKGNSYPEVLSSPSITGRTKKGTVAAAMCCFGGSVFDPTDPAAAYPNENPIPSVYLKQGACGFLGSTTTAWVGLDTMLCADWIVAGFLKSVLGGSSLGRAALEAKQDFVRWNQQEGYEIDSADEKTLIQFVLLGDPSLHPVAASIPAGGPVRAFAGGRAPAFTPMFRLQRRAMRHDLGELIRAALPERTSVRVAKVPTSVQEAARKGSKSSRDGFAFKMGNPLVQRVERSIQQPEISLAVARAAASKGAPVVAKAAVDRSIFQYYWAARRETGPVPEIRLISVQADAKGNTLRTQVLGSC